MEQQIWMSKNDGITTIGLTPELQDEVGEIAYAAIISDDEINVDDTLVNLEASKANIEIPSPIQGILVERNERAEKDPNVLNSENPADNWICRIRPQ